MLQNQTISKNGSNICERSRQTDFKTALDDKTLENSAGKPVIQYDQIFTD